MQLRVHLGKYTEGGSQEPELLFDLTSDLKILVLFFPKAVFSQSSSASSDPDIICPICFHPSLVLCYHCQGELDKLSAPWFIRKLVLNDVRHNLFPQRIFILSQEFAASAAADSQIQKSEIWVWDFLLGVYVIYR